MLIGLSLLPGLSMVPNLLILLGSRSPGGVRLLGQNRYPVDLLEAIHTQAVRITAADVV